MNDDASPGMGPGGDKRGEDTGAHLFRQSVSEADIDWLFCVELNSNAQFRSWVAQRVFPDLPDLEHVNAWRSVSNANGESDLLWLVRSESAGNVIVLIENKINALAQPEQYQRYVLRGESYVRDGLCSQILVVLLAPAKYRSKDSSSYPLQIPYEAITAWLMEKNDPRSRYLASIYDAAINKVLNINPRDPDITRFRGQVYALAHSEFPDLNVPDPQTVGAGDYWIFMRYQGYTLIHKTFRKKMKFTRSVVDLELAGRGNDVESLREKYAKHMADLGITVEQTYKSASFRLVVPLITPPDFDEDKVRIGLEAARTLKHWWERVGAD